MTQTDNQLTAITLNESCWKAIQGLIFTGCQRRGGEWAKWGEQILAHIQAALDSAKPKEPPSWPEEQFVSGNQFQHEDTYEDSVILDEVDQEEEQLRNFRQAVENGLARSDEFGVWRL